MVENKYYERKIKYLDLMESGERTGGAGFIKIEIRGTEVSLTVTVRGLHPTDTYERDVMLQAGDGESAIGRITLKEGQGEFKYHTVMDHSQLQGIRIILGGTREICSKWQKEKRIAAAGKKGVTEDAAQESARQDNGVSGSTNERKGGEKQGRAEKSREIQIIPWDEIKAVEESLEKVERVMSKSSENGRWEAAERAGEQESTLRGTAENGKKERGAEERGTAEERAAEGRIRERGAEERGTAEKGAEERVIAARERMTGEKEAKENIIEERARKAGGRPTGMEGRNLNIGGTSLGRNAERPVERPVQRTASGGSLGRGKRPVRLMEDKWQQIWAIYPHIHPFQDEREYLSISPADFVLLPDEAYRAANNSFLLHGYYNYDHLILTRIEKRGEISYYIGVPGNYYEREKQVAIMFGFESFECGTEPAQAGDFGYYMMRTQL